MDNALHPWNEARWAEIGAKLEQLPHALLLHGPAGLGKDLFARRLAQALLCADTSGAGRPCNACKSCHLFTTGGHPDLHVLAPEEEGKSILIEQTRALGEFLTLRPHTAPRKVALLTPADALNPAAANSLLKTLEEPPLGNYLLLVTAKPGSLPATIRSRCSRASFTAPPTAAGRQWLEARGVPPEKADLLLALADGAPVRALALQERGLVAGRDQVLADMEALLAGHTDPVACAARWKKLGSAEALGWAQLLTTDLVRLSLADQPPRLFNPDLRERLAGFKSRIEIGKLLRFFDVVSRNRNLARGPLDELLLVEEILIHWLGMVRRA